MTDSVADGQAAPLIEAIWRRDVSRVHQLLRGGADPNVEDSDLPALVWAVSQRRADLVRAVLDAGADLHRGRVTALSRAASLGHEAIVEMLLKAGADARVADRDSNTPLMAAAKSGRTTVIDILIRAGASIDARDEVGRTALYWASARGQFSESVYRLLAAGADPNAYTDGGTPL